MVTDQMLKDLETVLRTVPAENVDPSHRRAVEAFQQLNESEQLVLINIAGQLRDYVKANSNGKKVMFSIIGALEVLCAIGRLQVVDELNRREYGERK